MRISTDPIFFYIMALQKCMKNYSLAPFRNAAIITSSRVSVTYEKIANKKEHMVNSGIIL